MAAVLGRTEIGVKKIGSNVTVPNSPVAKLMYYFNCVCSCLEADDDATIRRLRDYKNYWSLSDEEEAKLLLLCLALSPDKLIGAIFIPGDENQFYEVSEVSMKMVVSQSILIGGQQKKVQKILVCKQSWIENNYLEPMKSFVRQQRPALPSPPPRQETSSSCNIL